jgi:adenylate cyclase
LTVRVARNWEQETLETDEALVSKTIINRVVETGQPILTTNAQEDPRFTGQESVMAYNLRSILCAPLLVKGRLTGVIYTDNRIRSGLFTKKQMDLLAAFANQAAVAIENASLFDSVSRTLSEVTELKNLMDNVFASIASGVITTDGEEKVVLCNRAAADILGNDSTDVVGQKINDVLVLAIPVLEPYFWKVLRMDEKIIGLEASLKLSQQKFSNLRFSLSPLKDAQKTTQGVAIVMEDLTEQKHLEAQKRMFEKMVSPAVIEQLDPNSLSPGGKRAEITVLFADIRGFTSYSEKVSPEQLVSVLNQYLALAAEAVLNEEGTVDKFMGDAVMAWFNAPILQPDHALRAVRTGVAIMERVKKLNQIIDPGSQLMFGVGIHSGEVVLGLVGTERRLEYTAIGDCVNTAKRIQENSNPGQILITQDTYQSIANEVEVRAVEPILAKGKRDPIPVYEVVRLKTL